MKGRTILKGLALGSAAVAIGLWSSTDEGRQKDAAAFRKVNAGNGPVADRAYSEITELGSWWAAGAAAGALAVVGHRRAAAKAFAAASITWLAGQGLKRAFERPRPYEADPEGTRLMIGKPNGASWPSTHPAVLVTFLTVAGRELRLGAPARRTLGALGNAVGLSRVYLGVHYPSDVTGGILLGRAVAELFGAAR
ncbi:MAG: phosphatase PAP2 family protein [Actinobacteria bacterium]|nr:phosphatase PAP2 family protein [Actinomycetota bacterium]